MKPIEKTRTFRTALAWANVRMLADMVNIVWNGAWRVLLGALFLTMLYHLEKRTGLIESAGKALLGG